VAFWHSSKNISGNDDGSPSSIQKTSEVSSCASSDAAAPVSSVLEERLAVSADAHLINGNRIRVAVPHDVRFTGHLYFDGPVRIDGQMEGEFSSTSSLLVSPCACVRAKVSVVTLNVEGSVNGQVEASDTIEIKSGGVMEGRLEARALLLREGGICNAEVKTGIVGTCAFSISENEGQLSLAMAANG